MIVARSVLWGARHPPERTRWTRGGGTNTTNFSRNSNGDNLMPVVPSDQTRVKV